MTPFARKRFGQHFLVDTSAIARIVEALDPRPGEAVLEIGPGRGALTGPLIDHAGRVGAVEVDRDLARALRDRHDESRLRLWEQDVLELSFEELRRALDAAGGLVVAGNLPYNISKPVAMKLVIERRAVARAVLMFQREVAERLVARPGERAYCPLGILAGEAWRVRRLFDVAPGGFRPAPKVVSTVTGWTRRDDADLDDDTERRLREVLAASFARRRQTLRNNLRAALGDAGRAVALIVAAGLDPDQRAEQIRPEGFRELARLWPPGGTGALV